MNGNLWFHWLDHVRNFHSAELFMVLWLTSAFCCRISEVLCLRARDFDWDKEQIHFGAFKYAEACDKAMVRSVKRQLLRFKRCGVYSPPEERNCGARGVQQVSRCWQWPAEASDFLFPSRRGAKAPHHDKDWVCHAISDLGPEFIAKFAKQFPSLESKNPRSHSGRRRTVTWMVSNGVAPSIGMAFAMIRDGRVYDSYADVPPEMVRAALRTADDASPLGRQLRKR